MTEVVRDVDGDKDDAGQYCHQGEDSSHQPEEAKESCGIGANLVDELSFLCMKQWGYPSKQARRYPRWLLVTEMVLDFRLIYDLIRMGLGRRLDYDKISHFVARA